MHGDVRIVGLIDAPIPWPIGQNGRARSLVVFGALAKAVRREAAVAVACWWGRTPQTVTKCRKALEVEPLTDGTHQLRSEQGVEHAQAGGLDAARAKANNPERCAKIAVARWGKPRPRHVIEMIRRCRTGESESEDARRKMSAAQRQRGAWPPAAGRPWRNKEDELVRTRPPAEVVKRTGRTLLVTSSDDLG